MSQDLENLEIEELRKIYKETVGTHAPPKARSKYLIKHIEEHSKKIEDVDLDDTKEPVKAPEPVKKLDGKFIFEDVEYPYTEEGYRITKYAVILKGAVKYVTPDQIKIIQKDRNLYASFELPNGTPYVLTEKKRIV